MHFGDTKQHVVVPNGFELVGRKRLNRLKEKAAKMDTYKKNKKKKQFRATGRLTARFFGAIMAKYANVSAVAVEIILAAWTYCLQTEVLGMDMTLLQATNISPSLNFGKLDP